MKVMRTASRKLSARCVQTGLPQTSKRIQNLMLLLERMPENPFLDKDEAYRSAGCDPKAAPYVYSSL